MHGELLHFRVGLVSEGDDLVGMSVDGTDGHIGKVTDVAETDGGTFLLVDTGPWILGRELALPAGLVTAIDREAGTLVIDRPKDEVKNAPSVDLDAPGGESAHLAVVEYFGRTAGVEPGPDAGPLASATPASPFGTGTSAGVAPPASSVPAAFPPPEPEREPQPEPEAQAEPQPEPLAQADPESPPVAPAMPESAMPSTPEPPSEPEPEPEPEPESTAPAMPEAAMPEAAMPEPAMPEAAMPEPAMPEPAEPEPPVPSTPQERIQPAEASTPAETERDRPRRRSPRSRKAESADGAKAPSRGRAGRQAETADGAKAPSRRRASRQAETADGAKAPTRDRPAAKKGGSTAAQAPLPNYESLTAAELQRKLRGLRQSELTKVERYERRNENRRTVIERIESLRSDEPWRGYDGQNVGEITKRLAKADAGRARMVRDYERRHKDRNGVLDAARRRLTTG